MEPITLPVYNTQGKEVETIKLDAKVFDGTVNQAVLYLAVKSFRANQRKGLASTKTRGEVSGGGRKPWKQKGTGRARVGSTRSPLWRHGGVIFGPHPRDFSYGLPKKIKKLALKSSLNAKVKENNLIILEGMNLSEPKTKEACEIFSNLNIKFKKENNRNNLLLLLEKLDKNSEQALRNISFLNINLAAHTHAYEVISHQKLIMTREALRQLSDRFSPEKQTKGKIGKQKAQKDA